VVDEEILLATAVYVNTVLSIAPHAGLQVEKALRIPRVHSDCFGTPDSWYYDVSTGVLHIFDYKYGWGIVEAFENWQAICYYAGILDILGIPDQHIRVIIHIVQPRPYHPEGAARRWEVWAGDLRAHVNQLSNAAHAALAPEPAYCSGKQCRYCKGRHVCLASDQAASYSVDISTTAPPRELTNEELGIALAIYRRAYKALEYRITGLEAQGLELARAGKQIPGQRIGHGKGSTVWTKPVGEVIALGELLEKDLRKPESVITPKQAIDKGIDKSIISGYSKHTPGAARLVEDSNDRARQIFGGTRL
jgi:hypothetical protein